MTEGMIHKQHVTESSSRCEECGKSFYSRKELDDHISKSLSCMVISPINFM